MFELGSQKKSISKLSTPIEGEKCTMFFYRYDVLFK
jgi:hypothetical protein